MIYNLNFVRVGVSDLTASVGFYRDVLGLQLIEQNHSTSDVLLATAGATLQLALDPTLGQAERDTGITLTVPDIEAQFNALTQRGVGFLAEPEAASWGGHTVRFWDPDRNILTLAGWMAPYRSSR